MSKMSRLERLERDGWKITYSMQNNIFVAVIAKKYTTQLKEENITQLHKRIYGY